jgi:hypothetical protein
VERGVGRCALSGATMVAASALGSVAAGAQESLPTIEVVGVSPVAGSEIDINKVPANVLSVGSEVSSYQVSKNVEVFGLIQNLFDLHYFSSGTFFNTAAFNSNTFGANNFFVLNDPRTFPPECRLRPMLA